MPNPVQPIANEFDSYLQDRAQRQGYQVRWLFTDNAWPLPGSARVALVEFAASLTDMAPRRDVTAPGAMRDLHDRGHFIAWAGEAGALVQVNVHRHELGGDGDLAAGRIGVRTFAEEFFTQAQARSLSLTESLAYLDWLTGDAAPSMVELAIRLPESRELLLVRAPSLQAAAAWLRRHA
ncbi:hypothetical protein GJ700_12805 [Duganella sp. FT92W]|uniref:Uncharacterized protein n=1 Tax=Pseudoduganella rivuli TaxID=2666085 RepID=A0A7X2LU22_9BURK|nr:hypothetical protein [Pseudoduganella rivuli]MRV72587.1 hypothetical protein [Pseudoduganella rivuli]